MYAKWAVMACAIQVARANADLDNQPDKTINLSTANVPTITQVTSIASPTASLSATLPSQVPLPPLQAWCPGKIFCPGAVSHVFSRRLIFDAHVFAILSSCKLSTSLPFGRTRKLSSTNPRSQISSLSWLRLRT